MMWFKKNKLTAQTNPKNVKVPHGLWIKCNNCNEIIYKKEVERNLEVCPKCSYHFRISAQTRINMIFDSSSFHEHDSKIEPTDPISFKDLKKYRDRTRASQKATGLKDGLISGVGRINEKKTMAAIFDFSFMGGSMGSVIGEKITRAAEEALRERLSLIIFCASGGARMQEGILSLMQMAKTSAAIARLKNAGLPYISVLTDPTMGGVTASFAMLGDVIIAEPRALIGFAGPRVIKETIQQKLPEGFQRAEYLLEHGMIDMIVERKKLRQTLSDLLSMLPPRGGV
jgi:acetyl-CoA carboxylase carboxyl transferase subunit beta